MVREQKFGSWRRKLEFIELCARIFKHDFVESAEPPTETGFMILSYRGGNRFSGVRGFPEEHTAFLMDRANILPSCT